MAAQAGEYFGGLATQFYRDVVEFTAAFARQESCAAFVEATLASRRCRRRRQKYSDALLAARRPAPPQWVRRLMHESFALYCVYRRTAVPGAQKPDTVPEGSVHFPRTLQRLLVHHGVFGQTLSDRRTIRERSNERFNKLWRKMRGRQVTVWMDNYYRRRFVANPAIGYTALSCSVLSVLHTEDLAICPLPPDLGDLLRARGRMAQELHTMARKLTDFVRDMMSCTINPSDVRVPLDVRRDRVRSLQWSPLQMTRESVSNNVDFVKLMEHLRATVLPHCRAPLPVLMDINLYYRHLKFVYSKTYLRWDYAHHFRFCPPIFGVWHSYKQACRVVWRRFHSQVVFLQHGTCRVGEPFPVAPRLRTLELLYAAVLLLPVEVRQQLHATVLDRQRQLDLAEGRLRVARRWSFARRRVVDGDTQEQRVETAEKDVRKCAHSLRHAVAMERLVSWYVPALFVIGQQVRECHWAGREAASSYHARNVMMNSFVVMLSLLQSEASHTEHLRVLGLALMMWQHWHDGLPGVLFSEEVAEASLSRLGESLRSNPHATTVEAADDLFVLVRPGKLGFRRIRSELPTAAFLHMVEQNVRTFIGSAHNVVTNVPWTKERMCRAVAAQLAPHDVPPPLGQVPVFEGIRALLGHYLRVLISGGDPEEDLHNFLDITAPRRGLARRLRYENECTKVRPMLTEFHRKVAQQENITGVTCTLDAAVPPGFRGGRYHRPAPGPHVSVEH